MCWRPHWVIKFWSSPVCSGAQKAGVWRVGQAPVAVAALWSRRSGQWNVHVGFESIFGIQDSNGRHACPVLIRGRDSFSNGSVQENCSASRSIAFERNLTSHPRPVIKNCRQRQAESIQFTVIASQQLSATLRWVVKEKLSRHGSSSTVYWLTWLVFGAGPYKLLFGPVRC